MTNIFTVESIQACPSHKAREMITKRHSVACVVENNTSSCLAGWVSPGSANVCRQCHCLISQIMNEKEADVMIMCSAGGYLSHCAKKCLVA